MLIFFLGILENDTERNSFSDFYNRVNKKCFHVAMKITNSHVLAEDAVHNAFLKTIEIKERFMLLPCNKQDSLIVIIVKNKAIDILRKERKSETELSEDMVADNSDLSLDIENNESYERLINLIGELPEIYKSVFELKYLQDLNNTEIAEILDITANTVGVRLNRAKDKLEKILLKEGVINGRK